MQTGARQAPGAFTVVVKKSILGAKVINTEQEDLGKIEDLVIDARNSRVAYAILSFGGVLGLGDKHFAIPWEALTFDLSQKVAVLDIDKNRLRTVWSRNSSRKNTGIHLFALEPFAWHSSCRATVGNKKVKIPTAIRSDGKEDLCKPEQGRRLARLRWW